MFLLNLLRESFVNLMKSQNSHPCKGGHDEVVNSYGWMKKEKVCIALWFSDGNINFVYQAVFTHQSASTFAWCLVVTKGIKRANGPADQCHVDQCQACDKGCLY